MIAPMNASHTLREYGSKIRVNHMGPKLWFLHFQSAATSADTPTCVPWVTRGTKVGGPRKHSGPACHTCSRQQLQSACINQEGGTSHICMYRICGTDGVLEASVRAHGDTCEDVHACIQRCTHACCSTTCGKVHTSGVMLPSMKYSGT